MIEISSVPTVLCIAGATLEKQSWKAQRLSGLLSGTCLGFVKHQWKLKKALESISGSVILNFPF